MVVVLFLVFLAIYFIPAMVAANRNHPNTTSILMLDLFLGWTLVGWVGALVWAFTSQTAAPGLPLKVVNGVHTKICPKCAEEVKAAALICRFCGYDFTAELPIGAMSQEPPAPAAI